MPLAADFRIANDLSRRITAGEDITFTFAAPENVYRDDIEPKSYVGLKYQLEGAGALRLELFVNGTSVLWTRGSGSEIHTTFEAFQANLLRPGQNTVAVRVTEGTGTVGIADIVVHYHVHV
jgi:hypothetical protein